MYYEMTNEVGNILRKDQSLSRIVRKAMKIVAEYKKQIDLKSFYVFIEIEKRDWQTVLKVRSLNLKNEFKFDIKILEDQYLVFDVMEAMLIHDDER